MAFEGRHQTVESDAHKTRLPMPEIVGLSIVRKRFTVARRQILQELDADTRLRGLQTRDAQSRPTDIVQVFLFDAVIFTFPGNLHLQQITIKFKASLRVLNDNRGVVNAEKQFAFVSRQFVPFSCPLAGWVFNQFEDVMIDISKIKGFDSGGWFEIGRQSLRCGRHVPNFVATQIFVGSVQIADDDGQMLKPTVVAA